ncbi:hypothetical protein BH11ARM1_BH11ARM1_00520 [soil metagenome]
MSLSRATRRIVGLDTQPEYPSFELLLDAEAGQPDRGFYLAARIFPLLGALIGLGVFLPLGLNFSPLFHIGTVGFLFLAALLGFVFDRCDKAISLAKKRIRKLSAQIVGRYGTISYLTGSDPVISPEVGEILDTAAAIYLKHSNMPTSSAPVLHAHQALESAMAKLLELPANQTMRSQELSLESGWARPLLDEMQKTDRALMNPGRFEGMTFAQDDPLANLRNAREELLGISTAIEELSAE